MADLNKSDIKLMKSQRLDDTTQGGGQMIGGVSAEVISGAINELFPDISRLDRVYGRVSIRKAFLAVQTVGQQTYYGAHAALTKNADDPNVSVCFFSTEDWFDTRKEARARIESYLVRGPLYQAALWGNHPLGTKKLSLHVHKSTSAPEVGEVIVLLSGEGTAGQKEQFVRVTGVSEEIKEFIYNSNVTYFKKIITLDIGEALIYDFIGEEIFWEGAGVNYGNNNQECRIYTTVAADASRYYGVSALKEDATTGELQIRVDSINAPLVPSAQSQTAITDAGVGQAVNPMVQTNEVISTTYPITVNYTFIFADKSTLELGKAIVPTTLSGVWGGYTYTDNNGVVYQGGAIVVGSIDYETGDIVFNSNVSGSTEVDGEVTFVPNVTVKVSRQLAYNITTNSKLYLGEGILPGSFEWAGGITLSDDGAGNILNSGTIVGSVTYSTGIIIFTNISGNLTGTGTATYIPACEPTEVACTGGIQIEVNNRGFVYTYNCDPIPKRGTLRVDYLSGGKWYSLKDRGDGALRGGDISIGSGQVNFITGSVSLTFGAMPDAGSMVMLFWAKNAPYYDLAGDVIPLEYKFKTMDEGVARNTFICSWASDTSAVMDDGEGNIVIGTKVEEVWGVTATKVGKIAYATGDVEFKVTAVMVSPNSAESFWIRYSYGDTYAEEFNPIREQTGRVTFYLSHTPIVPGTFKIEWHTDQEEYDGTSGMRRHIDPTHIFFDDTLGVFENERNDGTTNWIPSTLNYITGEVHLMPDRKGTFPITRYIWRKTGLFDENHVELREFVFHSIDYRPAASIWPTDGIIKCWYRCTDGANTANYYTNIPKRFYIKRNSNLEIIPGSLGFSCGSYWIRDMGNGKLFHSIDGVSGSGLECGTVDYINRIATITDINVVGRTISVRSCVGTTAIDPVQLMVFRTPGAPLVPGSLSIRATLGTGAVIQGVSNFTGDIIGDGVLGKIDFSTGVARVAFGTWLTDTWSGLPEEDWPEWYAGAEKDTGTGKVWKPYSVRASTVLINCVVTTYLPLDADLLGLDPVRLPMDGRVPIFRDGYIVLIHHTIKQNLPNPAVAGETYNLTRQGLDLIEVYDSTGLYYPEMNGLSANYSVDLTAGTVTFAPTANFVGYTQPFYALHRIEDMALASDVQITGHIGITNPLTHDYPANETMVSSVLPCGDLQARAYNEFVQSSWTGTWSDDLIGSQPLAKYDFVNFPITVKNNGAVKERWMIRFVTSTTFDIVGEHLGVLASGVSKTGWENGIVSVENPLTSEVYWQIHEDGFGLGWSAGNCIRFNTDAANYPFSFVRTTLQAPPTLPADSYEFQMRGDSA